MLPRLDKRGSRQLTAAAAAHQEQAAFRQAVGRLPFIPTSGWLAQYEHRRGGGHQFLTILSAEAVR